MTYRRTLKLKNPPMTGNDVREMQELVNRGLGITNSCMGVDGVFGPITQRYLAMFQNSSRKLKVDGICGPKTWAALDEYYNPETVYACTTSDKTLRIYDETALWLMRMVVGEGGKKCSTRKTAALCWAIVNRWFLWPGADHYSDFVSMMRAFSQPINPRWLEDGDLALNHAGRGPATPARTRRRARICAMGIDDIPDVIRENVELFAAGKLPYPRLNIERYQISNWASLKSTPTRYPWGVDIGGDWFFEDENLRYGEVVVK